MTAVWDFSREVSLYGMKRGGYVTITTGNMTFELQFFFKQQASKLAGAGSLQPPHIPTWSPKMYCFLSTTPLSSFFEGAIGLPGKRLILSLEQELVWNYEWCNPPLHAVAKKTFKGMSLLSKLSFEQIFKGEKYFITYKPTILFFKSFINLFFL